MTDLYLNVVPRSGTHLIPFMIRNYAIYGLGERFTEKLPINGRRIINKECS